MKTELKAKSVSLLLVTIMLCSIFAGAVTADVTKSAANTSLAFGNPSSNTGNTGYEPWYYYAAGGIVNTANGNLYLAEEKDISIKARGFDIEIIRTYNSHNSGKHGPFGFGWTFNYNIYLVKNEDGSVTFFDEDGSAHTFSPAGGGKYTAPPGIHLKLVKNPDDSFTLWFTDGSKYNFGSNGKINNITDKNGNHLNFTYNILGRLTRISDDSGLYLNLNYNLRGRINSVSDTLGREITYGYGVADLVKVTDAIGKSTLYGYYGNHKLRNKVDRVDSMLIFSYYDDGKVKDVKVSKYEERAVYEDGKIKDVKVSKYEERAIHVQSGYVYKIPYRPYTLYKLEYATNITHVTDAFGHTTTIEHNSNGNPIKITDPLGGVTNSEWDGNMNMVSFTDANGHTSSYEYDAYGNLIKETDALGNSILYEYTAIDTDSKYILLLNNITNARGFTTTFEYDGKGNQIKITDVMGNSSSMNYNGFGDITSVTDFRGYTTFLEYDDHGYLTKSTDALGNDIKYSYDSVGRFVAIVDENGHRSSCGYDANDNMVKEIDALGNETKYEYNAEGVLINIIDAKGHVNSVSHNVIGGAESVTDTSGNEISFEYDKNGNLVKVVGEEGREIRITYDALNRIISVTDSRGNTERYRYDAVGNVVEVIDENGHATYRRYDGADRLLEVKNSLGGTITFSWDANNNPTSVTDENGRLTLSSYDPLDRLDEIIHPDGTKEFYSYDENGNVISITDANGHRSSYEYNALTLLTKFIDALGNTELYTYDPAGNLKTIKDCRGFITTHYSYDELDRIVKRTDAANNTLLHSYDAVGNLIRVEDTTGNITSFSYDDLDQLIKITDPLGYQIRYEYDLFGNIISITDENNHKTKYEYDALNQLVKEINPLGYEISYSYDKVGNLVTVTNENGNTTRYEYGDLDRLTKIISPLGYQTQYSYDATGNIIRRLDANVALTKYEFDSLNRLILTEYPDRSSSAYEYDAVGNLVKTSKEGVGSGYIIRNSYDACDQLVSTTIDYGSFSKAITYSYDENGNRLTMTDPEGGVTTYEYDELDMLVSTTDPSGEKTIYRYDNIGRRSGVEYPNGVTTSNFYDAGDRLLKLINKKSNGEIVSSYTYTYDNAGNRLSMTEENGNVTKYEYDTLDRLSKVIEPSREITRYSYDKVWNRIKKTSPLSAISYTYDADNRLLKANGINYSYDNSGNLITKADAAGTTKYEYDYEDRMTKVFLPEGSEVSYQYSTQQYSNMYCNQYFNQHSQRLSKTDSNGTTYYLNDFEDVLMELDVNGVQKSRYTHGIGIDEPISMDRNGVKSYYHFDGLGSVTSLTDVNENIVASYKYDVFGEITEKTGSVINPYAFTGREYDEDVGLYYYRARYYDAGIGRFLSKDSIAIDSYSYVDNNPVNFVDPSGLFFESLWWGTKKVGKGAWWVFTNWVLLRPDQSIVEAYEQGKKVFNPRLHVLDRIGGGFGAVGNTAAAILECIPIAGKLVKGLRGLVKGVKKAKTVEALLVRMINSRQPKVRKELRKIFTEKVRQNIKSAKNVAIERGKRTVNTVITNAKSLKEGGYRVGRTIRHPFIHPRETARALRIAQQQGGKVVNLITTLSGKSKAIMTKMAKSQKTFGRVSKLRSAEEIKKAAEETTQDVCGYGESTKGIEELKRGDNGKKPPGPGNDHPDDNYDVSILTYSPRGAGGGSYESESDIAVLSKGFYRDFSDILYEFGESCAFVDVDVSIEELNKHPVFVIPSGGLYGLSSLPSFKSKLEQYVSDGGMLIVFSQQHGYEFDAAPGDLGGYGWTEDQSCHYSSVGISTYHPILSGQDSVTLDVVVDGFFTSYPEDATILLTRTKNGMPAMLMYEYGNGTGTVIATTIYTDWAYGHHQATKDGKNLLRDMISWAKERKDMPDYGSGDSIDIPINVTSYIDLTSDKVKFEVIANNEVIDTVNVTTSVLPYETKTVDFSYTAPSKFGIFSIGYLLVNDTYGEMQQVRDAQKFAVSEYAENSGGWIYQGKKITYGVNSESEEYAYGSKGVFTINIWNHGDTDRNITFRGRHFHHYGVGLPKTSLVVPSNGENSFIYTLDNVSHEDWLVVYFYDEEGNKLGTASKGFYVFHPSVDIGIETDQKEYAKGEDVFVSLNLTNKQKISHNVTVTVRTLDSVNKKIYEDSFDANLSAYESKNKTLSFSLPKDSRYGTYIVTAEAYENEDKIGSNSTYFTHPKIYFLRLNFDKPDKVYCIRQNMSLRLNITNTGSSVWSSWINTTIPSLSFSDSKFVSLNTNENREIEHKNLGIPADLAPGKHDVLVNISYDNTTTKDNFFIPCSDLRIEVGKKYNAGENLSFNISNVGGVDTDFNCSFKFVDWKGKLMYEDVVEDAVLSLKNKTISFDIHNQSVNGSYYLIVSCKDIKTGKETESAAICDVSGLKADLTSDTERKVYFKNENVSILTNVTNLNGEIVNGTLNLKIVRVSIPNSTGQALARATAKLSGYKYKLEEHKIVRHNSSHNRSHNSSTPQSPSPPPTNFLPGLSPYNLIATARAASPPANLTPTPEHEHEPENETGGLPIEELSPTPSINVTPTPEHEPLAPPADEVNESYDNESRIEEFVPSPSPSPLPVNLTPIPEPESEEELNETYKPITVKLSDIIIGNETVWQDEVKILNENLIVNSTGNLTLINTTLIMNCSSDGQYRIEVQNGGEMHIFDSNITASDSRFEYYFQVKSGAKFEMRDSELRECGHTWGTNGDHAGLWINTDNTTIENNEFTQNYYGIVFYHSSNNTIINNSVRSNSWTGIYLGDSSCNNTIINNSVHSNSYHGVYLYASCNNNTIINNSVRSNPYHGVYLYASCNNNTIINNSVHSNSNNGIHLDASCNNNIENNSVRSNLNHGVRLYASCNNNIENNTLNSNTGGIVSQNSHNNKIINNDLTSNGYAGIRFSGSGSNTIEGNNIEKNWDGICFHSSGGNKIIYNNITSNSEFGINFNYYYESNYNNITGNNVSFNSKMGIELGGDNNLLADNIVNSNGCWAGIKVRGEASNNILLNNTISGNDVFGLVISSSTYNILSNNSISNNKYINFIVETSHHDWDRHFNHSIDTSNTINGKPIYYLFKEKDKVYDAIEVGYFAAILCDNISIKNPNYNNVTNNSEAVFFRKTYNSLIENVSGRFNTYYGIHLWHSDNNTISNSNLSSNSFGIYMRHSCRTEIHNCNMTSNSNHGLYLTDSSKNNRINNCNMSSNSNYGVCIEGSSTNNRIENCNISSNKEYGVYLCSGSNKILNSEILGGTSIILDRGADNCEISNNSISSNDKGLYIYYGSAKIFNNTINSDKEGIYFYKRVGSVLRNNTVTSKSYPLYFGTYHDTIYIGQDIDLSNTFNGYKALVLYNTENESFSNLSLVLPKKTKVTNYGLINLYNCKNISIENATAVNHSHFGFFVYYSTDVVIENSTASSNAIGISCRESDRNRITKNTVSSNTDYGVYLYQYSNENNITSNIINSSHYGLYTADHSDSNLIYDNFFDNTINAYDNWQNTWNITKTFADDGNIIGGPWLGGNYWSDYEGEDTDGDELGDTLLPYNCSGMISKGGDYLPLVMPLPPKEVLWEKNITINLAEGETKNIVSEVPASVFKDVTGKQKLTTTLYSNTTQIINISDPFFYVTPKNTSLTLETDKRIYKPNETVLIYGEVKNHASAPVDCNLSIKKDGAEIFNDSFSLAADETRYYMTNTSAYASFTLEGTVDGVIVMDLLSVESPEINASIIAPDVVGIKDFDVGVLIENIGNITAELNVSLDGDGKRWDKTVPEGESQLLQTTMNTTRNMTITVIISGDVNETIQKGIICGERAEINITPEPTYLEGTVEIPFTITNIGVLDSKFNATFSISSPEEQNITKHFFVPKGENITDSVSFNLTKGAHLLLYTSPFETVNTTINVLSPPEFIVSSIHPAERNFTIGENVTLVFRVKNIGGSEGEAALKLSMIDFEDTNRTWIIAGAEENISFYFIIPDDLEEESYKGNYVLDGTRSEFTFFVQGANISVDASLDKSMYAEGDTAVLTLELTNECRLDLDLYSRVKFNEYDSVQNFTLSDSGTETLVFYVPANFSGDNKVLYTVYMDSGRALYINSIYIYEELPDAPLRLFTDKDVYNMGEEVTIHIVDVTGADMLNLTAPNFSYNDTISGPTTLEFTLPELRSGTYYIEYSFGNFSSAHPFDVRGYSARILEASLDKEEYISGNEMKLEMNIEANRDVSGLLKTWIYDPGDDLIDEFAMNKTLEEGENEIEVCRTLSTDKSGIHAIVYGFSAELSGDSSTMLVSGAEYFDAEAGGLCGDVAPYPDCNGIVDMGDVILLLNNVSYPENPRYVLCNDWAGDCRCTGVRDMGDVILLLNNVSYPEDLRYVLECC